ncbi:5390_t:CDS:2, partial [Dentiscutata erythropus]
IQPIDSQNFLPHSDHNNIQILLELENFVPRSLVVRDMVGIKSFAETKNIVQTKNLVGAESVVETGDYAVGDCEVEEDFEVEGIVDVGMGGI